MSPKSNLPLNFFFKTWYPPPYILKLWKKEKNIFEKLCVRLVFARGGSYIYIYTYELTKVGSDQRSSTIQYDSKSKHSKRRKTVYWTWEVACWFSFSLCLKISAVTYTTACTRTYGFVFERHQRSDFRWKVVRYGARALAVHALARSRAGPLATTAPALSEYSEAAPQSGQMSCGR